MEKSSNINEDSKNYIKPFLFESYKQTDYYNQQLSNIEGD